MSRFTPFHLVDRSPWPIFRALGGFIIASWFLSLFHTKDPVLWVIPTVLLLAVSFMWWRDVSREASYLGFHVYSVTVNLLQRIIWFIVSEVLFFFRFFWTFFYSALNPVLEVGLT